MKMQNFPFSKHGWHFRNPSSIAPSLFSKVNKAAIKKKFKNEIQVKRERKIERHKLLFHFRPVLYFLFILPILCQNEKLVTFVIKNRLYMDHNLFAVLQNMSWTWENAQNLISHKKVWLTIIWFPKKHSYLSDIIKQEHNALVPGQTLLICIVSRRNFISR